MTLVLRAHEDRKRSFLAFHSIAPNGRYVAASVERVWVQATVTKEEVDAAPSWDVLWVDGKPLVPACYYDEAWTFSEWKEYLAAWDCADTIRDHVRFCADHYPGNWETMAAKSIGQRISALDLAVLKSGRASV